MHVVKGWMCIWTSDVANFSALDARLACVGGGGMGEVVLKMDVKLRLNLEMVLPCILCRWRCSGLLYRSTSLSVIGVAVRFLMVNVDIFGRVSL